MKAHAKRIKIEAIDWENILANHVSDKGLIYRMRKEVSKYNSKKKQKQNPQTIHLDHWQKI